MNDLNTKINTRRQIVYDFLSLPFSSRVKIGNFLGLIEDNDSRLSGLESSKEMIKRAEVKGCIKALDAMTEFEKSIKLKDKQ